MHLVVSQKAGVTKVKCGSIRFILATHLAVNVTCDDCIAGMAEDDRAGTAHS